MSTFSDTANRSSCLPLSGLYRQIPAIEQLLRQPEIRALVSENGQSFIAGKLRNLQQQAREYIKQHAALPEWHNNWVDALNTELIRIPCAPIPVFNLTGTVLHTNLGRALLAESAIEAVTQVMRRPAALEFDLDNATRGHRDQAIARLLCELTGAEDACIVNNNAAAVLLLLASVAAGKEVIVSRGELVEIGGAFRIPDVMRQAGCQLHEVGATNRTHLKDYQAAINEQTGLLMKVHASNYSIQGFTAEVSHEQLAELGQQHQLLTAVDLGSGSLTNMQDYGLPAEPMPQTLIQQGIDLVTFSGDKLLGGPQTGIIIGKRKWIEKLQQHPLKRALRADKMTLAALEATLRLYQQPELLAQKLPSLRLLTRTQSDIHTCARDLHTPLQAHYLNDFKVDIQRCASQIGSGSLPLDRLPSWAVTFTPHNQRGALLHTLCELWRKLPTPVIGRIQEGHLWLDLRCAEPEYEAELLAMLTHPSILSGLHALPVHLDNRALG